MSIPDGCVVDGEVVVWSGGRLYFEALQQRLSAGKDKLQALVNDLPATFVGFDVLGVAGQDARDLPLLDRRALLEELASMWSPPLSLSPPTTDWDLGRQWFEDLAGAQQGVHPMAAARHGRAPLAGHGQGHGA